MYDKSDVHDDLIGSRQAIYQMPIMKQGIRRILVLHTIEARQKYALKDSDWTNIKNPTLVLWTDHDPTAKVEVGEKLASMIPGAKFVVMKDCGHWPQFEDADTFNRIHLEFLLGRPQ
jgi:2-hydroxy-6-oxonona-2,4-dienedioate hydrolase